jgi:hypothetical protein
VGIPEILRVTEVDLVKGKVVGIPVFVIVIVGDLVLDTVTVIDLVNGWVVGIPEIVREILPDLVNG